jgi:HSP20 family protein
MTTTRLYMTPWRALDTFSRLGDFYGGATRNGGWTPAIDIEETPEELRLTAELPGLGPENVEIQVEGGVLTLRGEKLAERVAESGNRRYLVGERSHGSFSRSFRLPRSVSADGIVAEFDNGLLRVRLPKSAEARSRRIPIGSPAADRDVGQPAPK